MHHGILGQKWGVRRGKNYPLEENQHSAAEKKAGWKKSLDNNSNDKKQSSGKQSSTKTDLDAKKLTEFAKNAYDFNSGDKFEEWYNKGTIDKITNNIVETNEKLKKTLSEKDWKEVSDHLNKANDLLISRKEHEEHLHKAYEVGEKKIKELMGNNAFNKKIDRYGNTVGHEVCEELFESMKGQLKWKDQWFKEQKRIEDLEARGLLTEEDYKKMGF